MPVSPLVAGIAYKELVGAVNRYRGERLILPQRRHPPPRIRHFGEAGVGGLT